MLFLANYVVALIAVISTYFFLRAKTRTSRFVLGLLWLVLMPNAAYLFTDFGHFTYEWDSRTELMIRISLLLQYFVLAVVSIATFVFSVFPIEKLLNTITLSRNWKWSLVMLFNFVVAFGVVLGRFEHVNSNVLFIHPLSVLHLLESVVTSRSLMQDALSFGLLFNAVYFVFRKLFFKRVEKYFGIGLGYEARNQTER